MKKSRKSFYILLFFFILQIPAYHLFSQYRFPRPEFKNEYSMPVTPVPRLKRILILEYLDVVILIISILAASYLSLKKRSRKYILYLTIFSVLYFGFWKKGCICPVGSIQNVFLAISNQSYTIPLTAILFFAIPLFATLFFGRTFCAAVCPLGAVQDLVIFRPVKLPLWLRQILSIIPYAYLGLSLIMVISGAGFLICRFDPFVGLFRLSASFNMFMYGGILLLAGIFIARPYCRFLCPYGALLNLAARFSRYHITITPDKCINCGLCENSCPFESIDSPVPQTADVPSRYGKKRLGVILLTTPLIISLFVWAGIVIHPHLAHLHPDVRLAGQIRQEILTEKTGSTLESESFWQTGETVEELKQRVKIIQNRFKLNAGMWGGIIGLVLCLKILSLSVIRKRKFHEIRQSECFSCARCVSYCSQERKNYAGKI